jgi:hypothetical protein
MIKDRGNIKWTAMMLPEHVALIKKLWRDDAKLQKPFLDEQQLVEINEVICEAMEFNHMLKFTYYSRGEYKYVIGCVHHFDHINKKLHIKDETNHPDALYITEIIAVDRT